MMQAVEDRPLEIVDCDSPMAGEAAQQPGMVNSSSVMSWEHVSPPGSPATSQAQLPTSTGAAPVSAGSPTASQAAVHSQPSGGTASVGLSGLDVPDVAASLHIPAEIISRVEHLLQLLQMQVAAAHSTSGKLANTGTDATAQHMLNKLRSIWGTLQSSAGGSAGPFFLFKDGPVTQAAKMGRPLFLEDFNLPSQAATERLNSLLEAEPSFAVSEDITAHAISGPQAAEVQLPPSFQVFASVHKDKPGQLRGISAATRSRFTEIVVSEYEELDVQNMITAELQRRLHDPASAAKVTAQLFALRKLQQHDRQGSLSADVRQLFRWVDFICTHSSELSLEHRIMLGARFLFFDDQHSTLQADVITAYPTIFSHSGPTPTWVRDMFRPPNDTDMGQTADTLSPFTLTGQGNLQLRYSGVMAPLQKPADMQALLGRYFCATTQTVVKNFARVFAALSAKSPLLLEGPPGIGKTAVVTQVISSVRFELF